MAKYRKAYTVWKADSTSAVSHLSSYGDVFAFQVEATVFLHALEDGEHLYSFSPAVGSFSLSAGPTPRLGTRLNDAVLLCPESETEEGADIVALGMPCYKCVGMCTRSKAFCRRAVVGVGSYVLVTVLIVVLFLGLGVGGTAGGGLFVWQSTMQERQPLVPTPFSGEQLDESTFNG